MELANKSRVSVIGQILLPGVGVVEGGRASREVPELCLVVVVRMFFVVAKASLAPKTKVAQFGGIGLIRSFNFRDIIVIFSSRRAFD